MSHNVLNGVVSLDKSSLYRLSGCGADVLLSCSLNVNIRPVNEDDDDDEAHYHPLHILLKVLNKHVGFQTRLLTTITRPTWNRTHEYFQREEKGEPETCGRQQHPCLMPAYRWSPRSRTLADHTCTRKSRKRRHL